MSSYRERMVAEILADAAEELLQHYHALDQARGGDFGWPSAMREWACATTPFTWEPPPPLTIRLALVWRGARLPGYVIGFDHGRPRAPVLVVPREAIEAHESDTWMGFRLLPALPASLRRTW